MSNVKRQLRGLSMVEAMFSTVIVSVLLVATLRASGVSTTYNTRTADRARAGLLADALMNEILVLPYEDTVSPVFGRESGETSSTRSDYDDVDDYDAFVESPPKQRVGTVIPDLTGWVRTANVTRVNATSPGKPSATETGARLITVTVRRGNLVLATRTAVRTSAP